MYRIKQITASDKESVKAAHENWNNIAKPLGSFGELEKMVEKIAGIQGTPYVDISKKAVVVMCADNGVVAEGVTQTSQDVTALCTYAIAEGTSNINAISEYIGAEVIAVDTGVAVDVESEKLVKRKLMYGTDNIANGSAMSRETAEKAISTGIDIVKELAENGTKLIITGEMGIGNTTTSSAVSSVILGCDAEMVTGRGAGLSDDGLLRKIETVRKAVEKNTPDINDAVDIISKVGGLDIAGITGLFLGGAIYHIPIVIDGFISAVSACLAWKINPICAEYMLPSHCSGEPAARKIFELMGLKPVIEAGLRLGEGTGGALLIPLLEGTLALYRNSHSFDNLGIERYVEQK